MESVRFQLQDGRRCLIRQASEDDAERVLEVFRTAVGESDFLARLPGEIELTVDEEREYIRERRERRNAIFILAEVEDGIAALAGVDGMKQRKFAHHGEVGMSVLRAYWRLGIGRRMLEYLVAWAQEQRLRKLFLRVFDHNQRAFELYRKAGFTEEGRLIGDVLRADGTYGDTIFMAKHFG